MARTEQHTPIWMPRQTFPIFQPDTYHIYLTHIDGRKHVARCRGLIEHIENRASRKFWPITRTSGTYENRGSDRGLALTQESLKTRSMRALEMRQHNEINITATTLEHTLKIGE